MSASPANPFLGVGAPPEGPDPKAQLEYLRRVVDAFHSTGHPRLKPLRQKLDHALEELARGAKRHAAPEKLAREFAQEVAELKLQTYELLVTVVNQARATLRVKLRHILPPEQRIDTEKLQKGLGLFSQGLRKALVGARKQDAAAQAEGKATLAEAAQLMTESGREIERAR